MVLGPRNEVTPDHPQTLKAHHSTWWALVMRPAGHPSPDTPGVQASTQGTPYQQHDQGCTDKGRGTGPHPYPDPHGPTHTPPPGHSRQAHTPHTTQQTHNVRTQHNDVTQKHEHNTQTNCHNKGRTQWLRHEQEAASGEDYAKKQSKKQYEENNSTVRFAALDWTTNTACNLTVPKSTTS